MKTLPDMDYCRRRGWVRYPVEPPHGRTVLGCARKYRRGQLSATAYTRLHRERLYAAGLTARGTVRKRRRWRGRRGMGIALDSSLINTARLGILN